MVQNISMKIVAGGSQLFSVLQEFASNEKHSAYTKIMPAQIQASRIVKCGLNIKSHGFQIGALYVFFRLRSLNSAS